MLRKGSYKRIGTLSRQHVCGEGSHGKCFKKQYEIDVFVVSHWPGPNFMESPPCEGGRGVENPQAYQTVSSSKGVYSGDDSKEKRKHQL